MKCCVPALCFISTYVKGLLVNLLKHINWRWVFVARVSVWQCYLNLLIFPFLTWYARRIPGLPWLIPLLIVASAIALMVTGNNWIGEIEKQMGKYLRFMRVPHNLDRNCDSRLQFVIGNQDAFNSLEWGVGEDFERIIGSTIVHPSGAIYAAFMPGRHHHCIGAMAYEGRAGGVNCHDQGFLTSKGRHVDRAEAFSIAKAQNQMKTQYRKCDKLDSYDVW